jgi:3-dehydroquinate dehydratase type I
MSKVCVPIRAKNLNLLKKAIKKASTDADIIEIWTDSLPMDMKAEEITTMVKKPLIIVNKGKKEKGDFMGTEEQRIRRLADFAQAGVDYVDVAVDTPAGLLKIIKNASGKRAKTGNNANRPMNTKRRGRTKLILSFHDFRKTPALGRLKKLRDKAFRAGAHLFKVAVFACAYEDNLTILRFLSESRRAGKPCIAHCMGKKGRISRLLAPVFGSYIIYAAADKNSATAPGQFTREEYRKISSLLKL